MAATNANSTPPACSFPKSPTRSTVASLSSGPHCLITAPAGANQYRWSWKDRIACCNEASLERARGRNYRNHSIPASRRHVRPLHGAQRREVQCDIINYRTSGEKEKLYNRCVFLVVFSDGKAMTFNPYVLNMKQM